jgi:hypothetical protein
MLDGQDVEVGAQRGDLHRHVVDVGPAHPGAQGGEAGIGLLVAEDRLTEQVDVDVEALLPSPGDVSAERRVVRGDDHATGLVPDPPAGDGGDGPGGDRRAERRQPQPHPVEAGE